MRTTAIAALFLLAGCTETGPHTWENNARPVIESAWAGCYDEDFHDIVEFEVVVGDPNGPWDVVEVWADVYDTWDGHHVDSFPLTPMGRADEVWYGGWYEESTEVNCWTGDYFVDFVAYDSFDAEDVATTRFESY